MKLTTVYFDAFKSLLNKKISLRDNCIGLVGINESGKSNILYAINALRGGYKLSDKDIPKMKEDNVNPAIRFEFALIKDEQDQILEKIKDWSEGNSLIGRNIDHCDFKLIYKIEYNIRTKQEIRSCELNNFKLNKGYLVLKKEFEKDSHKVKNANQFVPIQRALIVNEKNIIDNRKYFESCSEIDKLDVDVKNLNQEIIQWDKITDKATKNKLYIEEIKKKKVTLDKLTNKKNELMEKCKEFNITILVKNAEMEIKKVEDQVVNFSKSELDYKNRLIQLENILNPTPPQKSQLTQTSNKLNEIKIQLNSFKKRKSEFKAILVSIKLSLEKKYTSDPNELFQYISNSILLRVEELLPRVVFWEHKGKYILQSETLFKDIISKKSFDEMSRPLVNLFRIGLGIRTIDELKNKVSEISQNPNTRSQLNERVNKRVNAYLEKVWTEYDQKLKISLENDRIRVEIFDPKNENASFYNMEDRSQGAKTFLSFLFTIGAEAKHGILKNSILLLDEPESHLHPSGVRYLLKELNKIADKGNQVIYATHSIFMIDRENYDRHFITKKNNEKTTIEPSRIDRIGFFMQEEVLYSTLDKDLIGGYRSLNEINFVFEGMGDVLLFEYYYSNILQNKPHKLDDISFYHGGGCKRIKDFLIKKPIQLGTKWFFILDNDVPANDLKIFIEGKYKGYIGQDIYVFQYDNKTKNSDELELEDILPTSLILDTYSNFAMTHEFKFDSKKIKNIIIKDKLFVGYNDEIMETLYLGNDKESFKGDFKEILNLEIKSKLKQTKNEEEFSKEFPEYFIWVSGMIDKIKGVKSEK